MNQIVILALSVVQGSATLGVALCVAHRLAGFQDYIRLHVICYFCVSGIYARGPASSLDVTSQSWIKNKQVYGREILRCRPSASGYPYRHFAAAVHGRHHYRPSLFGFHLFRLLYFIIIIYIVIPILDSLVSFSPTFGICGGSALPVSMAR